MINYILVSEKSWHDILFKKLKNREGENWYRIKNKKDFNKKFIEKLYPEKIFIPHWSNIIKSEIWSNYECILFHMTDLPFGRGGSPLQNLILRNQKETKISAIRVVDGIDEGDIYLKAKLSLKGTAREIFERSTPIILKMIREIIEKKMEPIAQEGIVTKFKRRLESQGDLKQVKELNSVYDYIRMLDCEGYPNAFIETANLKFDFFNAKNNNNEIIANVRISKK